MKVMMMVMTMTINWPCWHMPIIIELGRQESKNCHELKARLRYPATMRLKQQGCSNGSEDKNRKEDLRSNSQNLHKKSGMTTCTNATPALGVGRKRIQGSQ